MILTITANVEAQLKRDIVNLLLAHLSDFHSYGTVKVYYDGGQQIVTDALRGGIEYALSKDAIVYRDASPRDYRLEQVADFLCTLELTCEKFRNGEQTETDNKFFGDWKSSESIILSRSAGKDWNHKFGSAIYIRDTIE